MEDIDGRAGGAFLLQAELPDEGGSGDRLGVAGGGVKMLCHT